MTINTNLLVGYLQNVRGADPLQGSSTSNFGHSHSINSSPSLTRSATFVRRQVASYWTAMAVVIRETLDTLSHSHVPPLLVYCMAKQLLFFMNIKIFNRLDGFFDCMI